VESGEWRVRSEVATEFGEGRGIGLNSLIGMVTEKGWGVGE
jgi:hypothetical protein